MSISRKLNIVHTIHFTLIFAAIFVINLFILKEVAYRNLLNAFKGLSAHVDHYVNSEINVITQTALLASNAELYTPDNDGGKLAGTNQINNSISEINVVSFPMEDSIFTELTSPKFDINTLRFIVPLDKSSQILVDMKPDWLKKMLDDFYSNSPYPLIIFNQQGQVIYSQEKVGGINPELLSNSDLSGISEIESTGVRLKNVKLFTDERKYLAHAVYNKYLNTYVVIYLPNVKMFRFLKHYPLMISIVFGIFLILLLNMVIRTNIRFTRPIKNIAMSLANSAYIQVKGGGKVNQVQIIQRSIDALNNQLEFYKKNLEKATSENMKIDKDIQVAKRLQRNILPKNLNEIKQRKDFEIFAVSEAAFDLGGDFYDYFMLDDSRLMCVIADIAGKGIPASLFMIFTHTLLRSVAKPNLTVAEIANQLNNKLIEENISDLFVTMLLGILDVETGKLNYCNAAHNLPLLVKESGEIEELPDIHGIPLGIYGNRNYQSSEIQLMPNDQLLFYTDGLVDAKDENGMNFSVDVLKYNLMGAWFNNPEQVVTKIQDDIRSFRGNVDPTDDMTILMLKYIGRANS